MHTLSKLDDLLEWKAGTDSLSKCCEVYFSKESLGVGVE